MKKIFLITVVVAAIATVGCHSTKVSTRDYAFEAYCDSIWENNPDYYLDVLCEGDEYQSYVEQNGQWWD